MKQVRYKNRSKVTWKGNSWFIGEPSKQKSHRNRSRGRQSRTYQHKLNQLQTRYNHLFRQSKKFKEQYLALPEEQRKILDKCRSQNREGIKPFFCDKYPTFEDFRKVNILAEVTRREMNTSTSINKKIYRSGIWGR